MAGAAGVASHATSGGAAAARATDGAVSRTTSGTSSSGRGIPHHIRNFRGIELGHGRAPGGIGLPGRSHPGVPSWPTIRIAPGRVAVESRAPGSATGRGAGRGAAGVGLRVPSDSLMRSLMGSDFSGGAMRCAGARVDRSRSAERDRREILRPRVLFPVGIPRPLITPPSSACTAWPRWAARDAAARTAVGRECQATLVTVVSPVSVSVASAYVPSGRTSRFDAHPVVLRRRRHRCPRPGWYSDRRTAA